MAGRFMAGTSAISQFTDGIGATPTFFMFALIVIPGMTTGTIRLIGR
jgi:hypothetical protein